MKTLYNIIALVILLAIIVDVIGLIFNDKLILSIGAILLVITGVLMFITAVLKNKKERIKTTNNHEQ